MGVKRSLNPLIISAYAAFLSSLQGATDPGTLDKNFTIEDSRVAYNLSFTVNSAQWKNITPAQLILDNIKAVTLPSNVPVNVIMVLGYSGVGKTVISNFISGNKDRVKVGKNPHSNGFTIHDSQCGHFCFKI